MVINNKEYAWGDIVVVALGRPFTGITGIEYTAKKVKEQRYGSGRDVKSIQHGRREPEGTITLMQSEVIAMNQAAKQNGYRDLLDIEIDIIVSYASEDGIVSVDKIIGASFSELPKGMKEGDLQSEHALPFVALDIEEDAV